MPKFPKTIVLLILSCLTTVIVLYFIQFYLVRNTYYLTKEKYYNDVEQAINKVLLQKNMSSMHDNTLFAFKKSFYKAHDITPEKTEAIIKEFKRINDSINVIPKKVILDKLDQTELLHKVKFEFCYDKIIVELKNRKGKKQIFTYSKPITIIGKRIDSNKRLYLAKELIRSKDFISQPSYDHTDKEETLTFSIHYSKSIDISNSGQKIFMRMLGVFLLAAGLILVITILFYIILSNLIKQRKIADIKTDFANNVSHELKTPLASLNIIVKSLTKSAVVKNKHMFDETLQALKRQNERLQQITNSVLETSIYSNNSLIIKDFEISDFMNLFLKDFRASAHKIVSEIEQKKQHLKSDPIKLQSILNNIIENAMKYSPEGSEIEIKSFTKDNYYVISIKDAGIGIARSDFNKIFKKFYRITKDKNIHTNKGLGLGLYLSAKNIAELGGSISLESEIGKGSTFFIKIPINEN